MKERVATWIAAVSAAMVLSACQTPRKQAPPPATSKPQLTARQRFNKPAEDFQAKMPMWVDQGSGAFESRRFGPAFFGVGRIEAREDLSTVRKDAKAAANAALATELGAAFEEILERWAQKYDRQVSEVSGEVKAYAERIAAKGRFVDAWRDPKLPAAEASTYGISVLTKKALKRQLTLEQSIDRNIRNFLLGDLDLWFKQRIGG